MYDDLIKRLKDPEKYVDATDEAIKVILALVILKEKLEKEKEELLRALRSVQREEPLGDVINVRIHTGDIRMNSLRRDILQDVCVELVKQAGWQELVGKL